MNFESKYRPNVHCTLYVYECRVFDPPPPPPSGRWLGWGGGAGHTPQPKQPEEKMQSATTLPLK